MTRAVGGFLVVVGEREKGSWSFTDFPVMEYIEGGMAGTLLSEDYKARYGE